MARLSKEAEKKIERIIRIASAQVYAALGKLYRVARRIDVIARQELQKVNERIQSAEEAVERIPMSVDKAQLRRVISEASSLWLKVATLYNKVYKEGASGLEVHVAINGIKASAESLAGIVQTASDNPYDEFVTSITDGVKELRSVADTIEEMVARTGTIAPAITPEPVPREERNEIPSELQDIIQELSSIADNEELSDETRLLAREYVGRVIRAVRRGGQEFYNLIKNNFAEARAMIDTVRNQRSTLV